MKKEMEILPIGTCVEGIRVEFSTPGYKNTSILAIANIKNSKYQTNVARSAIELDANNEILKEEIGVKNFGGIYIQSNTELCEYLIKVIGAFQSEDTEENKILLEVFLSYVFDNKVLEVAYKQDVNTSNMFKQLLEERFVRVSNELIEKMWAKIDTQEFVNKILTKNYTLYSIDNWSRKNDSI